jgi:hypothetical protein
VAWAGQPGDCGRSPILAQYVAQDEQELDKQELLANLLTLKYHTISDAAEQLGGVAATGCNYWPPAAAFDNALTRQGS